MKFVIYQYTPPCLRVSQKNFWRGFKLKEAETNFPEVEIVMERIEGARDKFGVSRKP